MRIFTIDEANELLPQVRGILLKIKSLYAEIATFRADAKVAAKAAQTNGGGGMPNGSAYVLSLYVVGELTSELDRLGVQLKDYERGLIDFPAMRDGKLVLLCWELGEGDEIMWWHELDKGFSGRKLLDESLDF